MKIQVLGMGCPKCLALYDVAKKALVESGVSADLVKVQDSEEIMSHGVMITPALAIDGSVKCAGRIASKDEIVKWIRDAK